jgi:hypothetical protein
MHSIHHALQKLQQFLQNIGCAIAHAKRSGHSAQHWY